MRLYALKTASVMAAFSVLSAIGAQEPDAKAVSGMRTAACLVQVASDPQVLLIDANVLEHLVQSTPVAGAALREVFGENAGKYADGVSMQFIPVHRVGAGGGGDQSTRRGESGVVIGRVQVEILEEDVPPVAEELLDVLLERLRQAVKRADAGEAERIGERLAAVDRELQDAERRFAQIRAVHQELIELAGQSDLSRARIEDTIRDLEETRASLELRMAGAAARENALLQQIAKIAHNIQKSVQESDVAAELQKVVEIREKEVGRMLQRADEQIVSRHELEQAQEQLAHARAALAQYRESASESAGGALLAGLNKDLVDLNIESAEMGAELVGVQERLAAMRHRKLLELADRYETEVEMQRSFLERTIRELMSERERIGRQFRDLRRPELRVMD
jgi:hypothetical protein